MLSYNQLNRLHLALAAACPIRGATVGTWGVAASVTIDYEPAATPAQQQAAQQALASFDWSDAAQTAFDNTQARGVAQTDFSDPAAENKLQRAVLLALLDEINTIRGLLSPPQPPRTVAQARAAVAAKLTSGAAD